MYVIKKCLMVVGKEIVVRFMMYVVLIYDYWFIDGWEVVLFLCVVKDNVEDLRCLFLDV